MDIYFFRAGLSTISNAKNILRRWHQRRISSNIGHVGTSLTGLSQSVNSPRHSSHLALECNSGMSLQNPSIKAKAILQLYQLKSTVLERKSYWKLVVTENSCWWRETHLSISSKFSRHVFSQKFIYFIHGIQLLIMVFPYPFSAYYYGVNRDDSFPTYWDAQRWCSWWRDIYRRSIFYCHYDHV